MELQSTTLRRSFDIFDTLLVRDVGSPADLFLQVGQELKDSAISVCSPENFRAQRVAAETAARKLRPDGEVNLDEIYERLADSLHWEPAQCERAKTVELEWESRSLHGVPSLRPVVASARREAGKVIFLSDMYLPAAFLRDMLRREGFYEEGDEVFVSNEFRASKSSGELFQMLLKKDRAETNWVHMGDNSRADVESPSRLGIKAVHFSEAHLNRYESMARGEGSTIPLWRSHLAGAMRAARLSKKTSDPHLGAIWDSACDVVGPLLFGFVHWCLEQAVAKNIQRLYFVSRDGQIFFRIAQHLCHVWKYPLECRYLYGSRRAWNPAAVKDLSDAQLDWLVPKNGQLSIRQIFARVNLAPEAVSGILLQSGFPAADWNRELSEKECEKMRGVLLNPAIKSMVAESARQAGALAAEYMRQEGLTENVPILVVDVGWNGNMQRSLGHVLDLVGGRPGHPLAGFYLGLLAHARGQENKWDYWSQLQEVGQPIDRHSVNMLELFASATHPSVIGYRREGSRVEPVFHPGGCEASLKWGVSELQEGTLEFVRRFAGFCRRETFPARDFQIVARKVYERFYFHPSAVEAKTWGCFSHLDSDIERPGSQPVPDWSTAQTLKAVWDFRQRPPGWWPEGMLALRRYWPLSLYLAAKRTRWLVEDWFNRKKKEN